MGMNENIYGVKEKDKVKQEKLIKPFLDLVQEFYLPFLGLQVGN